MAHASTIKQRKTIDKWTCLLVACGFFLFLDPLPL
jgi:hypothetical protein